MAEIVVKLVNGELAGKTAQSIAKEVNAAAMAYKKATVGTQEWVDAGKKLDDLKKLQSDLKTQTQGLTSASDLLKQAWDKLPGASYFNEVVQSFGLMKQGVGGLVNQFGVLKTAIASTGIGLLVIAFATLVDWFKNTDEGATLLAGIFRGLGAVTDRLLAGIRALGSGLVNAFKNPKQAIIDLVNFIKDNLMNRVKAFGVAFEAINKLIKGELKEGLKELGNSVIQFNTGVTEGIDKMAAFGTEIAAVVKEGIDLEAELDRISDRARELAVQQAETEKSVSQLLLQSKNVGLSYKERVALLNQAGSIETKNHKDQLKNAMDLEAALKREYDEKQRSGKVTDELDQKYKDAQIARINMEKSSIDLQEKISNRKTALLEKEAADMAKKAAEELKIKQNIQDLSIQLIDDEQLREVALLKLNTQRKIENLNGSAEQIKQQAKILKVLELQEIAEIEAKFASNEVARAEKARADKFSKDAADADLDLATKLNELNRQHLAGLLSQQDYITQSQALAIDNEKVKLELTKTVFGETSKEYQEGYARLLGLQTAANDTFIKNNEELTKKLTQSVEGTLGVFANLFGSLAGLFEEGTQQYKDFATAQAIISTIQGAVNAYTSALAIPYVGEVLAPIAAAGALASGYNQVRKIQNTDVSSPVKAELGMVLQGPSHAEGGIPIEAEGDEIILTKGVYRNPKLRKMASDINVAAGGRKFASGGPVNPFQDRSPVSSGKVNSKATASEQNSDQMPAWVPALIAAQDRKIARLKVINVMSAPDKSGYQDQVDILNKIKDDADV